MTSSDDKKTKSKKKKPKKGDDDDKSTAKAKSKAEKENKIQKPTQSVEKGMLNMATELRELRGLPEATQKQLEEQQKPAAGTKRRKRRCWRCLNGKPCSSPTRRQARYHRPQLL